MQGFSQRGQRFCQLIFQLTLPDGQHSPAERPERFMIAGIARDIVRDLLFPEFSVVLRPDEIPATFMTVPEAAIDEDYGVIFRQDDVRGARQPSVILAVTESVGEEIFPDNLLRFRIPPADP